MMTRAAYVPNPGLVAGSRGSFVHRLVAAAIPIVVPLVEHAPHLRA